MTTTRQLCRALGAALQVREVERHAARLVRDGYLPRAGEEADEQDSALLLLVILGTPRPEQASQVAETMMDLPRQRVSVATGFLEGWMPATKADEAYIAPTLVGLIADGLECMRLGMSSVSLDLITAAQGEAHVTVKLLVGPQFYRATYGMPVVSSAGLRTFASVSSAALRALADSLKPDIARHAVEHAMPSLATH